MKRLILNERDDNEPCLFITERKPLRRMSIDSLRYVIKRISLPGGYQKTIHPHQLRHSINKFYEAFKTEQASHITIQDFESSNIQEVVNSLDIVYVGGGNTQYMLRTWQRTHFDAVLRNAYRNGVILAGISAGAMCWFDTCFSKKNEEEYEEFKGLGILRGSLCPHYNDENRRKAFDHWAKAQKDSN